MCGPGGQRGTQTATVLVVLETQGAGSPLGEAEGIAGGIAGSSVAFDRARGQGSSRRARSKDKCGFLKFLIW